MIAKKLPLIPDDLQDGARKSLYFHLAILIVFTVKGVFFSSPDLDYQSAIRVDLVALPDKLPDNIKVDEPAAKPAPPQPAKEIPKPEVKAPEKPAPKEEAVVLKKTKEQLQKESLQRLKSLAKLEEEAKKEEKQKSAIEKLKAQPSVVKGNRISPGSALHGTDRIQFDGFMSSVDAHIRRFWDLPRWLAEEELVSLVNVKMDKRGFVIARQVIKSSGNATYDEVALATIDKASPFPIPPDKFVDKLEVDGFNFEFRK